MICRVCGKEVIGKARFCPYCGVKIGTNLTLQQVQELNSSRISDEEYHTWIDNLELDCTLAQQRTVKTILKNLVYVQTEKMGYLMKYFFTRYLMKHLPKALKTETDCLVMVRRNGEVLRYVPEALKTEDVCLAAVQQNSFALGYVPEVKKTEALCVAAVQQNGLMIKHVPKNLMTEALCMEAVRQNDRALKYVPKTLKARLKEACGH